MAEEQAPNFQDMPATARAKKYNQLYDTLTSQTVGDKSFADMYGALQEAEVGAYKEKTGWPYIFTGASRKSSAFGPLQITYSTALDYFYPGDSETEKRDNMKAGNFKEGYTQLPSDVKSYIKGFIEQGINKRNNKGGVYGSFGVGDISSEDHKKHYPFLAAVHVNEKKKIADADTVPSFVNAHFGDIQEDDPKKEDKQQQLANLQTKVSTVLGVTAMPATGDEEGFSEPKPLSPAPAPEPETVEPEPAPKTPETKTQTDAAFTLDYEGELPDVGDDVPMPDLPATDVAPDTTDAIPPAMVDVPEEKNIFERAYDYMFGDKDTPEEIQQREQTRQRLLQSLEMNEGGVATAIQESRDIETGVDTRTKQEMLSDQMAGLGVVGKTAVESVPGVGEAIIAKEVAEDVSAGDYLSAGIGTAALGMGFLPAGDIINKPVRAFAKKFRKTDEKDANKFLDDPDSLQAWRDDPVNKVDKAEKKRRETRKYPEQAKALESGLMSGPEYRRYIRENQPATKFTLQDLQTMVPTFKDTVGALGKSKASKGIVGLNKKIEKGTIVDSRLDIPAYNDYNTWVATITLPNKGGNVYGRTAVLKDVDFSISTSTEKVRKIAKDETKKFPMATMQGKWQDLSDEAAFELAQKYLADPKSGYVQVGFNPERHSFFYDKDTMMPIFEAEEVVQIGALVLAKPKLPKTAAERAARIGKLRELKIENPDRVGRPATFNEGGIAMEKQMDMFDDGGLMDEGGTVDPVSGNDVPPGSTQEEVRDDIPAQLSEGEFVFPADVVRYIGLEKLMQMRQEAKMGLKRMEDMGQMGNSEEAVMPDDLPFTLDDLEMEDEPMEFQVGGLVPNPYGTYQQASQFASYGQQPYQAPTIPTGQPMQQQQQPVQAAGFQTLPVQQVPTAPSTVPTFEQLMPTTTGKYDELREYVNEDTGQSMTIPFVDGKPIYPIPQGFTPKPTEQVEAAVPETTVPTAQVAPVSGDGDDDERRRQEEAKYGPGGGRVGLGGYSDGTGRKKDATIVGVSFDMPKGFIPGAIGAVGTAAGLLSGGGIPKGATATFFLEGETITVDAETYNNMKAAGFTGDTSDSIISKLKESKRLSDRSKYMTREFMSKSKEDREKETAAAVSANERRIRDRTEKAEEIATRAAEIREQQTKARQEMERAQRVQDIASSKTVEEANRKTEEREARQERERQEDRDSGGSGQTFQEKADDFTADRIAEYQSTDFSGRGFAEGGLAGKPKPKAKKMKQGGMASKK